MNNDELLQLAEMFDAIVNSNNPAVQRSLQHTMVLAKLTEEKQNMEGPFLKMFRAVDELRGEMKSLRRSVQILENNSRTDPFTGSVDLNMHSGMGALTTAQITALTVDSVSLGDITLTPVDIASLNLENYMHNTIKF